MADEGWAFTTEQVHAGFEPDEGHGARITPVYLSAGFLFDDFEQARDRFAGDEPGYTYTRMGNPTVAAVERKLAALEHGAEAIAVGSGQAAVTVAALGILHAGDHLVSAKSIYEGSRGLFRENFTRFGIEASFVGDANDADAWRAAIQPNTKLLFIEPIPNPKNDLVDVELVAGVAREFGIPLLVDNTLSTPYLLRPADYGAAIVVHSTSKFLSGHGSSLGGVVVDAGRFDWGARPDLFPHLNEASAWLGGRSYVEAFGTGAYAAFTRGVIASRLGPILSPINAFLLQQGIETLSLRVAQHSRGALAVARWLEQQPEVESVDYAGLESSPSHALALRYFPRGYGSVFSFTLRGGEAAARAVVNAVELFSRMTHLGDVRSLVLHPASTTHTLLSPAELAAIGLGPGLLRLSIGIEEPADLIADLERAFAGLRASAAASDALVPSSAVTTADPAFA